MGLSPHSDLETLRENMQDPLFLGLDLSAQQLKAILITASSDIVKETAVHFDNDLPQYKTTNGAIHGDPSSGREGVVAAPVAMFLDALDMLMEKMKSEGVDFSLVKAIGGSAQQHGSVYWSQSARKALQSLDPTKPLREQLAPSSFSVPNIPIWQDSSTTVECNQLQNAVGGPQTLADITGSRAYERFTGAQILKLRNTNPEAYSRTGFISLISSFLTTLFIYAADEVMNNGFGFPTPIEISDASGMNMMNVLTHKWDESLLTAIGGYPDDLRKKLGGSEPVAGGTALGTVGNWWKKRWDFPDDCLVSPFTGDNPATVAGLIAKPGSALLSLGTSTTFLLSLPPFKEAPKRATTSHLLAHPSNLSSGIIMLCYKNGALAREEVRNNHACKSWDKYNELVKASHPGTNGYIGLYFPLKEIIPPNVQGNYFFKYSSSGEVEPVDNISSVDEPRAILESQLLSIKSRLLSIMPQESPKLERILVTGGSAFNPVFQQVIADVFDKEVYVASEQGSKEAAALGGALLGKWIWWKINNKDRVCGDLSFEAMRMEDRSKATEQILVASPDSEKVKVYEGLMAPYRKCEEWIVVHSK